MCFFGWIVFFTHTFCRWMTSYKLHLTDTIERMNKGQNIQGRMRGGGKSRGTPPPSNRSILKKPSIVSQACICKKKMTVWKPSTSWSIGYVSYHCGNYFTILHEIFLLSLFNLVITILYLCKLLKTCIGKNFYFLFSFIWKNWKKYPLLRCIMFWIHVTEWYTSTCSGIFMFWGECLLKLHELTHYLAQHWFTILFLTRVEGIWFLRTKKRSPPWRRVEPLEAEASQVSTVLRFEGIALSYHCMAKSIGNLVSWCWLLL